MRFYFLGICGTAMGHVAVMLKERGHEVCGSDSGIYPPMSEVLAEAGIAVRQGFDERALEATAPDGVVVGNAISRGNPEVEWLLETQRFPLWSLPGLLSAHVLGHRRVLVFAGTHGKTTTATIAACLLRANGQDCGYLIGGVPHDLPSGAHWGSDEAPFVIEGDEYDSAFFDKRSKFVHYHPWALAINNIEFDHGDIFRDVEDVRRSFAHACRLVPRNGYILTNGADAQSRLLPEAPWTQTLSMGDEGSWREASTAGDALAQLDCRVADYRPTPGGSRFCLHWRDREWADVQWGMCGLFNARNAAMAALASGMALHAEEPWRLDLGALRDFQGVRRRQEVRHAATGLTVIEDFGHHPTAIEQTLVALRERYASHRLLVCFEPRSNTARSPVFQTRFTQALAGADEVLLGPVHRKDQLRPDETLDLDRLAAALNQPFSRKNAEHFETNDALLGELRRRVRDRSDPWLVVFFTNGDFGGIIREFVENL